MSISPSNFDASMGAALHALLNSHGLPLLGNPAQLKALLSAQHPQAKREIAILGQALEANVPHLLLSPQAGEAPLALAMRVAQHLSHETAMTLDAAQWAVHTWQQGVGQVSSTVAMAPAPAPMQAAAIAPLPVQAMQQMQPIQRVHALAQPLQASPQPVVTPTTRLNPKLLTGAGAGAAAVLAGGAWFLFASSAQITDVHTSQAHLIGDGKPQAVTLAYTAKNTDIKAVDVRFVRGDGQWGPTTQTINVDSGGRNTGELSAGTLTQQAIGPMNATFEYTLVSNNGKRSEPFEHTFKVVPPVLITSARLPSQPRLNQPYTVHLNYKKGAGDIVQITRRVVDSTVPWAQPEQTTPVQLNQATGSYDLALEAQSQPMRSTLEFEMVDSLGVKSDPVRVAVNVATQPMTSGPATVVSVVQVSGGTSGVGVVGGALVGGALGNQVGKGSGKTAATILGAIAGGFGGNAVEKQVRGPSVWETTVRFADGNTRRVRHNDAPRWAVGQGVKVTGGGAITL